uniref:Uncharacterized protein n=1 Tax=Nelumbo nucifera TaxID=4432 RepID=A0A822Z802_NELNU|nr:TPA_asm: hypothetical protein HUJ06_015310 [Nelumbo nucifera]
MTTYPRRTDGEILALLQEATRIKQSSSLQMLDRFALALPTMEDDNSNGDGNKTDSDSTTTDGKEKMTFSGQPTGTGIVKI